LFESDSSTAGVLRNEAGADSPDMSVQDCRRGIASIGLDHWSNPGNSPGRAADRRL